MQGVDTMEISLSYDYEKDIELFEFECFEYGIADTDEVRIVRRPRTDTDYKPIVDYLFEGDDIEEVDLFEGDIIEFTTAKAVLDEMKEMNEIFR